MRVLKNETKVMRVKCPKCKSILELEPSDLSGGDVTFYAYTCIVCSKTTKLDTRQIPLTILEELER